MLSDMRDGHETTLTSVLQAHDLRQSIASLLNFSNNATMD